MSDRQRRQFLRLCGVSTVASIAGCSQIPGLNGSDTQNTNGDDGRESENAAPSDTEEQRKTQEPNGVTPTATLTPTTTPSTETPVATATPTPTNPPAQQGGKLAAIDGDSDDNFGGSVAVSDDGTTAIIGAAHDEEENGNKSGAAYVFTQTDEAWNQQAKLAPDDGDPDDRFGGAVSVSDDGTTAVIAAEYDEDPNGRESGSAYVFTQTDEAWNQRAKLTASDGDPDDRFGGSVTVSGDGTTAVIGAARDEEENGRHSGSVYVFTQTDGTWSQQAKLAPDDGDPDDRFGGAVSVSDDGTTVGIGAAHDEDLNGRKSGSVYVFTQTDGAWSQRAKLAPDDGDTDDFFGGSVAVAGDGTTAVVGADRDEEENGRNSGSAYVFTQVDETWSQRAKLAPDDGDSGDYFGGSVTLSDDGTTAVIGAARDEEPNGANAGSAYVFTQADGAWSQREKLIPNDGDSDEYFGGSVSVSGDGTTAVIGAARDEDPNGNNAGSAYVFQ